MVLCSDLEILVNDFWTSTPYEFNGLMRGAYQRQAREASLHLSHVQSKKPIKLEKYVGFKLRDENVKKKEADKTSRDLMLDMELEDRKAFMNSEKEALFDLFNQ